MLSLVEKPDVGGDTWFMDLAEVKARLEETKPDLYKKLKECHVLVETAKIPDFVPLIRAGMDLKSSLHQVIHTHPFTQKETLFLSNPAHAILESDCPVTLGELIKEAHESGIYEHKWEEGDLLVWDNVQVMHRSSGEFEGRRLLLRI
jgi:taurine dioxygenase